MSRRKGLRLVWKDPRRRTTKVKQRIIWATEDTHLASAGDRRRDERVDEDTRRTMTELMKNVLSGKVCGLVFAAIGTDGELDLVASGVAFDSPLLASGASTRLRAMLDGWETHPSNVIPDGLTSPADPGNPAS